MSDFCFKLDGNISDENLIIDRLKKLYNDSFENDAPIMIVISKSEKIACLKLLKRGKKVMEIIEEIHKKIKKDIIINKNGNNIIISPPFKFTLNQHEWWKEDSGQSKEKWTTLSHKGPYLPDLEKYIPHKAPLIYEGKKYILTPQEEKVANFYAKRLISERGENITIFYTKDPVFNKNFFTDFKKYLDKEHSNIFKVFSKIDWTNIVEKLKEIKENESTEEKSRKKVEALKRKHDYGFATINGIKEEVGNFTIEASSLFLGRGKNPNRGKIKREITPEDIIINIGIEAEIPKPPKGYAWGGVKHDKTLSWIASWKDPISNENKYVYFSAQGQLKGKSDLIKYEKARKLQRNIELVRKGYTKDMKGSDIVKKQLGTVLYLIDNFGFRAGGEKSEDEADTVGASTLRVEHVQVDHKNGNVLFDFIGKDSIRFYKKVKVPTDVTDNITLFIKAKKSTDLLFDKISALEINNYLRTFDKDFSAKVFRTKLASMTMYNELKNIKVNKKDTPADKKVKLDKVNAIVAELLNHKRTVPIKTKLKIDSLKKEMEEFKQELAKAKKTGKGVNVIQKKIDTRKRQIESKSDTLSVAINTSKQNYIDPRILISWGKEHELPISKIYTPVLQKKFSWAINTIEKSWDYLNSPLLKTMEKLEPVNINEVKETSKVKEPVAKKEKKEIPQKFPKEKGEKGEKGEKEKSNNYKEIISFYKNGENKNSYSLEQILKMTNEQLEIYHDFIQTLFPLYRSGVAESFLLDADSLELFKTDDTVRYNVFRAYKRMLDFYGYDIGYLNEQLYIKRNRELDNNMGLTSEHNYLRISRMLKFLMLINMKILAFTFLLGICEDLSYNDELLEKIKNKGSLNMWIKIIKDES